MKEEDQLDRVLIVSQQEKVENFMETWGLGLSSLWWVFQCGKSELNWANCVSFRLEDLEANLDK